MTLVIQKRMERPKTSRDHFFRYLKHVSHETHPMTNKQPSEDDVLQRMLNTPPQPKVAKPKKQPKKPAK